MSNDTHIQKTEDIVSAKHHLIVRELAGDVRTAKESCCDILTQKLKMHQVVVRFVQCLMRGEQKEKSSGCLPATP